MGCHIERPLTNLIIFFCRFRGGGSSAERANALIKKKSSSFTLLMVCGQASVLMILTFAEDLNVLKSMRVNVF